MKLHFYFLSIFFILSYHLKCQIIYEKSNGQNLGQSRIQLSFENENYITEEINNSERIFYLNNKHLGLKNSEEEGVQEMITLSVIVPSLPIHKSVLIFNEDGYFDLIDASNVTLIETTLPAGIYDIVYRTSDKLVVKELLNLNSNIYINFYNEDAKNEVLFNNYNDNGELIDNSNSTYQVKTYGIVYNPTNINFSSTWAYGEYIPTPHFKLHISDVSDRYGIYFSSVSIGNNGKVYIPEHHYATEISGNVEYVNSSTDWMEFQENTIAPSVSTTESDVDVLPCVGLYNSINGYQSNSSVITLLENFNYDDDITYVFNKEISNIHKPIINLGYCELVNNEYLVSMGNSVIVSTSDFINGNGASIVSNSIGDALINMRKFNGKFKLFPFHEKFSYLPINNSTYIEGNTAPIFITSFIPSSIFYKFLITPIGRSGEIYQNHFMNTNAKIYSNSNLLYDGNLEYLYLMDYLQPTNEKRIVLTNENTIVDDLIGKNITEILYTNLHEDKTPPTLQMLQFRGANGKIKERFEIGESVTLRLSAGDFYFNNDYDSPDYSHFLYQPGNTVEVYYSKYNENNWSELSITKFPEHFQMPRFGDYYEASLAGIQPTGNDVWYDLKVICTDAVGNKQTQTISPAFQLNSTLATEDVNPSNDLLVYPNPFTDNLYFEIPESLTSIYTLKVTDLSGKQILSEIRNQNEIKKIDLSFLPKGIYVFSIEADGKLISKKVIKK